MEKYTQKCKSLLIVEKVYSKLKMLHLLRLSPNAAFVKFVHKCCICYVVRAPAGLEPSSSWAPAGQLSRPGLDRRSSISRQPKYSFYALTRAGRLLLPAPSRRPFPPTSPPLARPTWRQHVNDEQLKSSALWPAMFHLVLARENEYIFWYLIKRM